MLVENPRAFVVAKIPEMHIATSLYVSMCYVGCFPKLDAFKAKIRNFGARMNINKQDLKHHPQTSLE